MKIEPHDPTDLHVHPLKKQMPRPASWQKGGDDFNRLLEDIRERGIITPLLVSTLGEILDGEVRWMAAKILHLEVPTLVVNFAEAASVILGGLLQRQHFTKSALAYIAYPLMAKAHQEANSRRLEKLRKGQQISIPHAVGNGKTVTDLAQELGVARTLFEYAARLHAAFTKTPALRTEWEPKILAGEVALGPALAGIAGGVAGGKRHGDQLRLWVDVIEDGFNRALSWKEIKGHASIWQTVDGRAAELEPEELEALIDFHSAMAGRLKRLRSEGVGQP